MGPSEARAWYVISLRPQGGHDALRRAAARAGGGVIALSPWTLVAQDDDATRAALRSALDADVAVFTSPAAVRFAQALQPLSARSDQTFIGTGSGTRAALRRLGVDAIAPGRMDSEGLLALPALADLAQRTVGLVTAPDGRGTLAPALRERGAQVRLAEVYARQPIALSSRAVAQLDALATPACVLVTSGGALQRVVDQLPETTATLLRAHTAIAASARLVTLALQAGFDRVVQAEGPRPAQLLAAVQAVRSHRLG